MGMEVSREVGTPIKVILRLWFELVSRVIYTLQSRCEYIAIYIMSKSNSWSRPKVVHLMSKEWGGFGKWLIYLNATWFLISGRATV